MDDGLLMWVAHLGYDLELIIYEGSEFVCEDCGESEHEVTEFVVFCLN